MGGGLSGLSAPQITDRSPLGNLPESCVAVIFEHLEPPEICRLASLNGAFRQASMADVVWESKLPTNYKLIVRQLLPEMSEGTSKKEIYARLCKPIRFDAGTKEVWLEKSSGKMCMSISWRGLTITGIDDRRYWTHIPCEESRFNSAAFLHHVWWLEVGGEIEFSFPEGRYSLFFRLRIGRVTRDRRGRQINGLGVERVHGHGWSIKPVRFQMLASNSQSSSSECYLNQLTGQGWVHYHVGDFVVQTDAEPTRVKFSMNQIDCTHTKGGLCLDSVFIYPIGSEWARARTGFVYPIGSEWARARTG